MNDFNLASLNIDYFNLKDFNFFGAASTEKVKNFVSEEFDLLINVSEENSLIYDYVVSSSLAKFKIGKENDDLYDLLIKVKTNLVKDLVTEVIFYLDLISKNNK